MIKKIDHIGLAVRSLAVAIPIYEQMLGLSCLGIEEVPSQKVRTAFFEVDGVRLELLEALSEDSPIAKFISKRGEGVHHLAFATDDLGAQLEQARVAGATLIDQSPTQGAGGKSVAFVHPKSLLGVLTEFCSGGYDDSHPK